jgi:protein-S-isoprenylcysteine O-methyltransferase Ste14
MMAFLPKVFLFLFCSFFFVKVSWKTLKDIYSHGFYRFFAFEGILILLLLNESQWFVDPFSMRQFASWLFLISSPAIVLSGLYFLKNVGGNTSRETKTNFHFENTEKLVTVGIYKYIRHPMYSSLLFLNWGIVLKDITMLTILLGVVVSMFLYVAAKTEEKENIDFFGGEYLSYIKDVKMFIPFVI